MIFVLSKIGHEATYNKHSQNIGDISIITHEFYQINLPSYIVYKT